MVLNSKLFLSFNENIGKKNVKMHTHIYKYDNAKTPYKRCLESDKLSDKEKLTNIKKSLNIIELKKSVEKALNDVLQHIRKP